MVEVVLLVVAGVEAVALVTVTVLWRRARRQTKVLRQQLGPGGRRWLPTGREAVKAVWETASLVRERGLGGALRSSIEDLAGWAEVERPDLVKLAGRDGTVTILFSDIEGSTSLNEELGDQRWLKVLARHEKLVRGRVGDHGGHVVKNQGDGFMVAFAEADEAVACGVDVQRGVESERLPTDGSPMRVRIGIHKGDAVHRDGDLFGRNVAFAARVASQADGGQVLISRAVRDSVDAPVDGGRDVELKGLAGVHRLYLVEWSVETR